MSIEARDESGMLIGVGEARNVRDTTLADSAYVEAVQGGMPPGDEVGQVMVDQFQRILEKGASMPISCTLYFIISVPDAEFYDLDFGGFVSETFARSELERSNYTISMTITE